MAQNMLQSDNAHVAMVSHYIRAAVSPDFASVAYIVDAFLSCKHLCGWWLESLKLVIGLHVSGRSQDQQ